MALPNIGKAGDINYSNPSGLLPPAPTPGFFHIVDFRESRTSGGPEAVVTFEGPSDLRFELIDAIFPHWYVSYVPPDNTCCAYLISKPIPYPDLRYVFNGSTQPPDMDPDLIGTTLTEGVCDARYNTLWPDSYSIRRGDRTCKIERFPCDNINVPGSPNLGSHNLDYPLYYGAGDGSHDACSCIIDVTYRRRYHASWPGVFAPCESQNIWRMPAIPEGTYVEVRTDPTVNFKTMRGRTLKYEVNKEYKGQDMAADGCERVTLPMANDWGWCSRSDGANDETAPASLIVASDLVGGQIINSMSIEVTWRGVPLPQTEKLNSLQGKVNDSVFLGHPPESVLFESFNPIPSSDFGTFDLYDIVLNFTVLKSPVILGFNLDTAEEDEHLDMIARGVYQGQIGIWNRLWSDKPIRVEVGNTGVEGKYLCTNWVRVVNNLESCCVSSDEASLYQMACLDSIFDLYEGCPQ